MFGVGMDGGEDVWKAEAKRASRQPAIWSSLIWACDITDDERAEAHHPFPSPHFIMGFADVQL